MMQIPPGSGGMADPVLVVDGLHIPAVLVRDDGGVAAISPGARALGVTPSDSLQRTLELLGGPSRSLVARAVGEESLLLAAYPMEEEWFAHELRNALAIVSGAAFVLRRGQAGQRDAALALIEEQVTRMTSLL